MFKMSKATEFGMIPCTLWYCPCSLVKCFCVPEVLLILLFLFEYLHTENIFDWSNRNCVKCKHLNLRLRH